MQPDLKQYLQMTFQLPGGVSAQAENRLWKAGILTWDDYRRSPDRFFSTSRHHRLLLAIERAESVLTEGQPERLLQLPSATWQLRLYPLLWRKAVFLDIETTGLDVHDSLTTAALHSHGTTELFVAGYNLQTLPQRIPADAVLVTSPVKVLTCCDFTFYGMTSWAA